MENSGFLNSYRNVPPSLLRECQDGYEIPDLWKGFKTGLIVAGLNHGLHMAQESIFLKNYKKYLAIVAGESSDNMDEATGIGEVILRRMELKGVTFMNSKFIDKIGGAGEYDAIGGREYNNVMKMSYIPKGVYYSDNWW